MTFQKGIDLLVVLASCISLYLGLGLGLPIWYFAAALLLTARTIWLLLDDSQPTVSDHLSAFTLVIAFFLAPPDLSDDFQRYLWEGFAANKGYSPYLHSPQSLYPILDHPSEGLVNHSHLATIYPPLAQFCFRIAAWVSYSVYSWKAFILLSLLPLWFALDRRQFLILISCPAILFEGIWNTHLDVLGVMPLCFMVLALSKRRPGWTGALLAVLTALKIMPLLFSPFCFFFFRGRERLKLVGVFALVILLAYLPYLNQWEGLFGSFLKFSSEWYFNNPFFHGLEAIFDDRARILLTGGLLLSLSALLLIPGPVRWKLIGAWLAMIVFSPTVHPWYLLWLIPLVPEKQRKWLHLSYMAVFFSYLILIPFRQSGIWEERFWWMIPEWALLLFCMQKLLRPGCYGFPNVAFKAETVTD